MSAQDNSMEFGEIRESRMVFGDIDRIIEYNDGRPTEFAHFKNTILSTGRTALAKSLANDIGSSYQFYISRMLFGNNGTTNGVPKYVDQNRNGLFGMTVLSKPVISNMDEAVPTQVIITSVIAFDEANGIAISEMALQMKTGDLYSMRSFPDITKSDHMQITFNWRLSFI